MAGVDEVVADLIRRFPCSYTNRTKGLHQALVVLGSGYEWHRGEIRSRWANDTGDCRSIHRKFVWPKHRVERMRELGIEVEPEFLSAECPFEDRRGRARELARVRGELGQEVYPASLRAPLFSMPDDVTEEWRQAVLEMAEFVLPLWRDPGPQYWAYASAHTEKERLEGVARVRAMLEAGSQVR